MKQIRTGIAIGLFIMGVNFIWGDTLPLEFIQYTVGTILLFFAFIFWRFR